MYLSIGDQQHDERYLIEKLLIRDIRIDELFLQTDYVASLNYLLSAANDRNRNKSRNKNIRLEDCREEQGKLYLPFFIRQQLRNLVYVVN